MLAAAVDAPVDAPITIGNRGDTAVDVIAGVLIEKGERFTVTTVPAACRSGA